MRNQGSASKLRTGLAGRIAILLALVAASVGVTAGAAVAAPQAPASPSAASTASAASADPVGDYAGSASANLAHVTALQLPGVTTVADAKVIPASSTVDSTASPQATSTAKNVGLSVLNNQIPVQAATQTAAPDNPTALSKTLVDVPLPPLLDVSAINATVHSRWAGADACVPVGTPISSSKDEVANVQVIPSVAGLTAPVLSLDNQAGGTAYTKTTVGLTDVAGQPTQGVQSTATTQLTGVNLAGQFTLNVVAPLQLTATAGGTPGSAKVSATQPVIQVLQGSKIVFTLDATHTSFTLPLGIITLSLGTVTPTTDANGLTASATGSLLNLTVGTAGVELASVKLGEVSVSATAPSGGVNCPTPPTGQNPLAEVHKDASAATAAPGSTFTYTITVPNRGTTEIDDLKVIDTITGPAGSTVVATTPKATSVNGLDVSWSDPNPLQPNETRDYTITVKVPTTAKAGDSYTDTATASGTYKGQPVTQTVTLPDIPKVAAPPYSGCHPNDSNKAADHLKVMPGESFDYYIHVLNDGNQPCTGLTVTDTLDGNVTFVSCTFNCTHSGQTVTWTVPDLGPGSSVTLAVTVKVKANATGTLPNDAVIHQPGGPDITLHTDGPTITTVSVLAPPVPPAFGPGGGNNGGGGGGQGPSKLAFTGWATPGWILFGLLAAVAACLELVRRSRRTA